MCAQKNNIFLSVPKKWLSVKYIQIVSLFASIKLLHFHNIYLDFLHLLIWGRTLDMYKLQLRTLMFTKIAKEFIHADIFVFFPYS